MRSEGKSSDQICLGRSSGLLLKNDVTANDRLITPSETLVELSLPVYKPSLLQVHYGVDASESSLPAWHLRPRHPSAATDVYQVPVISARVLTAENALKKTLELSLDISNLDIEFEPGDSFGLLCQNDAVEVDAILLRLGLLSKRHTPCRIYMGKSSKAANLPKHIPPVTTSLFDLFLNFLDIRAVPKKVFLRILAEYTADATEKRRLLELSSRQGSSDYLDFIVAPRISLLDLLNSFTSCLPPVECLIENLHALQPRAYSITNSPLVDANRLRFVFNLIEISAENGRTYDRAGICTKWLDDLTRPSQKRRESDETYHSDGDDRRLNESVRQLTLNEAPLPGLHIFMRKFNNFRLPEDHSKPLVLIGPGTGVAPFIGFLDHRSELMKNANESATANDTFGKILLFFGCRHQERDFLFKDRLKEFQQVCVLSELIVCFSRDKLEDPAGSSPPDRYVQDCVRRRGNDVFRLIHDEQGVVFVCGDATGMANDVYETIVSVVQTHGDFDEASARNYVKSMQETRRYFQDVWT